jgi:hypothetical protein
VVSPGNIVVWLPEPFAMGAGTIIGVNEIGWIEVYWPNGELGAYPGQQLELADRWERRQVEEAVGGGVGL